LRRVTLYNHRPAGDLSLPLVPNIVFKSMIWLLKNHCLDEDEYLKTHYALIPDQERLYYQTKKENTN
jgi:hypothetical protein